MTISIQTSDLLDICGKLMDGHVSYSLGAKAPSLNCDPVRITQIDCSGFVQYVLYKASNRSVHLRSGSWFQNDWCSKNLAKVDYASALESDGWLRLGYFPGTGTRAGHIWLILDGNTLESHGGKGPDRRAWNDNKLINNVKKCYKLAQTFTQHENNFFVGERYFA
jgi:hypothetical protein